MAPKLTFDRTRCLACRSCELACAVAHSRSRELRWAIHEEPRPMRRVLVIKTEAGIDALRCEQCEEPLCVFSCKTGALHRAPDDWRVVLDEDQCVGCLMCLMVCPFGIRPDPVREQVARCDVCRGLDTPACVDACPTDALDVEDVPARAEQTPFDGHVVIVGSSAAGMAAAEAAREHAPGCAITVVTADRTVEYSRPLLAYALAGRIEPGALAWRSDRYLERDLGATVLAGVRAVGIDTVRRTLALEDGRHIEFDRLVIATGARSTRIDVPGAELAGVHALRDLADLAALERNAQPGRRAVILGGGNVGLQVAEALLARGLACTLVVRSPHVLSQMVDEAVGRRVGELFAKHGLVIRTRRDAVAIVGEGRVEGVCLDDGEVVPADVVIVGKGIRPNVEWVRASGIRTAEAIVVDTSGRTSAPGIYAAGDSAEMVDPLTGRSMVSAVWPIAYEMGRVAGTTAVGVERAAGGALRMNASRFFGVSIISLGEVRDGRLPGAKSEVLADTPACYRKVAHRGGRLVGALLYGDVSNAGLYYRLYRDGVDLGDLRLEEIGERPAERLLDDVRAFTAARRT